MSATLYCGDVRQVLAGLPDGSVQCCVTSPPYWGLRDYGTATWEGGAMDCDHRAGRETNRAIGKNATNPSASFQVRGDCLCGARRVDAQLGLERTPEEYVANMVAVFREVRRVLRDDGVLWLNLGDSYAAHPGQRKETDKAGPKQQTKRGSTGSPSRHVEGLKAKDLVGIPWMVAFALRADGWYLRSEIIWAKPNPMPESVTDRPTKAHEQVFLLSKSERYYYDADAIAEPGVTAEKENYPARAHVTGRGEQGAAAARGNDRDKSGGFPPRKTDKQRGHERRHAGFTDRWDQMERDEQCGHTRNARSVWTIATQPYPQAHFAVFPEELARRCILAGSSAKSCETCGAPWERVVEREGKPTGRSVGGVYTAQAYETPQSAVWGSKRNLGGDPREVRDLGWRPTCDCEASTGAAQSIVLDPFGGSGTTAAVAVGHGRQAIYIDLNPAYLDLARGRIGPMLCRVPA